MKADYKNWVPNGMMAGFGAAAAALSAAAIGVGLLKKGRVTTTVSAILGAGSFGCSAFTAWCVYANRKFSYDGQRQLSRQIIDGTAEYVTLPAGGTGLDVGCGSGALTIACAKKNPQGIMLGIDPWGPEYAAFCKELCEQNARAEGVTNTYFQYGNAVRLDFPDETFDAVTSNYVYHNITGKNKQALLRETLRVLKKGGTFAIHDLMSKVRYGDMEAFVQELKEQGYEEVRLIDTTKGMFMTPSEARRMMLGGSTLLVGKK
ncbi:MAG: class I SAM-dependent methyltransferase [Clostridia bacterium]|nr:class I SAM-dependent methyltransferase [Clostridia bacterium]